MINEGYRILGEGVALRAVDIDMVWLHGYGFPPWRGGPMFYANQVGPARILDKIEGFREQFGGDFWTPAMGLREAAAVKT
jgi:3-hydroxyacyl-CoA dehydrogenase